MSRVGFRVYTYGESGRTRPKKISFLFILISWGLFLSPFKTSAADIERDLQQSLIEAKNIVEQIQVKLPQGVSISSELSRLKAGAENVKAARLLLDERFAGREAKLKSLGSAATARHQAMVEGYRKALDEYLALINAIPPDGSVPQSVVDDLKTLLDTILIEKKPPIIGSLPYKHLAYPSHEPNASPIIVPAYKGGNRTAGADDLKSTNEAPLTKEIATLAQSLNWNPVSIYEYVKNNVETEWYWGCMKGAEETLRQKSGNDCDQAALLTALLRASGFPSRYVRGVIELSDMERMKNLTGVNDGSALTDFIGKAGIPYKAIIAGGAVSRLQLEHVWVESLIPYANYRGAVIDDHGKTWLGLDTSVKVAGYTYNTPLDILAEVAFSELRDQYLGSIQTLTPLEFVKSAVEADLELNHPGKTYADVLRTRTLSQEVMDILPASMQYDQIAVTGEYTEIPDELKHRVKFTASDKTNELFSITLDAGKLSNRQVVLTYEPETVEDQEIIDSYGGLDNTPAYLIRLRPVLKVSGERMVVGKDGLPMGAEHDFTVELISPNGTERVVNKQVTGNVSALGVAAQKAVKPETMTPEEKDAERLLFEEAVNYIDRWNQAEEELASLFRLAVARPVPTVVTLGGVIDVAYLLNMPHGFEWKGAFIDADMRAIETARSDRQKDFMALSALQGSVLEDRIFKDDFQVESISTAKLFGIIGSTANGPQIVRIDKNNIASLLPALPLSADIKADIADAVNQNYVVTVPDAETAFENWKGTGYIKENPATGEAGYMLSGMIAGGMTAWSVEIWPAYYAAILQNSFAEPASKDPLSARTIQKITPGDLQTGRVGEKLSRPFQVKVRNGQGQPVKDVYISFVVKAGGGKLTGSVYGLQVSGAGINVPTDGNGIATAWLTLGTKTSNNAAYMWDTGYTYLQQVGENIVDAALPSAVSIAKPFTAYGFPKAPHHINKAFGDNESGPILSYKLISLIVEDEYNNPISNERVTFKAMPAQDPGTCNNANLDTRPAYLIKADDPCVDSVPTYGSCSNQGSAMQTVSSKEGTAAGVLLGAVPNALYQIEVTAGSLSKSFSLYTNQFGNCDGESAPDAMMYIAYTYAADAYGHSINAGKIDSSVTLQAKFFALKEGEKEITETLPCSQPLTCKKIVGSRQYAIDTNLSGVTVDFGGYAGVPQGGGVYKATYTIPHTPQLNTLTVTATGTLLARRSYNSCYGCLIINNAKLTASPKVPMEIYGVDPALQTPGRVFVDVNGYSMNNFIVKYTIAPSGYKASNAYVVLYKNGTAIATVPTETTGAGFGTFLKGMQFDALSTYEVQLALNLGTGVEIRSDKKALILTKINKIEVYDSNNECNRAPGKLNNMLLFATNTANKAYPKIHLELVSNIDVGQDILWRYTGENASPSSGNFSSPEPLSTLTPSPLVLLPPYEYDYKLDIAADGNSNGIIDGEDTIMYSFVLKLITPQAYNLSKDWLNCIAKPDNLCGPLVATMPVEMQAFYLLLNSTGILEKPLGSSFLLTFLDRANDAPIQPVMPVGTIALSPGVLDLIAGANFQTDCSANIRELTYDKTIARGPELIAKILSSSAIRDLVKNTLQSQKTEIVNHYDAQPTNPYPTTIAPVSRDFREYIAGKFILNDLGLAFGTAAVEFSQVTASLERISGKTCVKQVHLKGSVTDRYDWKWYQNDIFGKRAAVLQIGYGSTGVLGTAGQVFNNRVEIDEDLNLQFCL